MSFAKGKLKLARDSIGKKDFVAAKAAASQVLDFEPDNYNAYAGLPYHLVHLRNGSLETFFWALLYSNLASTRRANK